MLTTNEMLEEYQDIVRDTSSSSSDKGKRLLAHHYNFCLASCASHLVERTKYGDLQQNENTALLPKDYMTGGIKTIRVKDGNDWRPVLLIPSLEVWQDLTRHETFSLPTHATVINEQGNTHIELYPTPNADVTDGLEVVYDGYHPPLTFPDDYSTGSVSISTGGTAVTGGSTAFTSAMIGRFIKPTDSLYWYEIKARTDATHITLLNAYDEATLSNGTYTIAEVSRLPQEFVYSPVYAAAADYFRPTNGEKAKEYDALYVRDLQLMQQRFQSKTRGRVTPGRPLTSRPVNSRLHSPNAVTDF